ncbi:MAG: 23S rRNA (guanosine(2251)-2'-O)-methyltransferase RlmB [Xanthomonadales bacterium]|nr:23S rRNA (guanosine-2'-O-)-methyltransferase RlmB [Xanthomonadales bacterium]MCC6591974.1 23S rRNA (guanosine(2251)-2'-O)-methyltransferase RlmB [Xanthomonadales bacterium]
MSADNDWLLGPNAVEAQLEADPTRILEALVEDGRRNPRVDVLLQRLKQAGIAVARCARAQMDKRVGSDRHQGIAARWRLPEALDEADLLRLVEQASAPPLILVLDGVQDPHNLGACIRSAAAAGALAVVVPKDRAVGLTPTVVRASAGMAARMPLVRVTNLARALERIKRAGVWVGGAAGEAQGSIYDADLRGPSAIVMGSEGEGLRELTRKTCDYLWRIPIAAGVESLNVSVAAGVCLFEAVRQRGAAGHGARGTRQG